jgi:hypothetical protein
MSRTAKSFFDEGYGLFKYGDAKQNKYVILLEK